MGSQLFRDISPINFTNKDITIDNTKAPTRTKKKNLIITKEEEESSKVESEVLTIQMKHNRLCEDKELIDNCIIKHFFMRTLEKAARLEIIKEMSFATVPSNTIIFQQGTPGNFFYILKVGTVELYIDGKKIKTFSVGESFGELALLHGAPRSGTVKAITECGLWVLERKNFRKIVDHITKMNFEENKTFIQSVPILNSIEHYQQAILCVSLIKETFEEGKLIVKEGESANCIYIVKEGEVNIVHDGKVVRTLKRGENFGERSILVQSLRTMDVVAKTNCVCYSISKVTLQNMLGEKYITLLFLNFMKASFITSKYFKIFNTNLLKEVFHFFEAINLGPGSIAFEKGYVKSSHIVVIIDGHLIDKEKKEIVANRGALLFEEQLLNNSQEQIDCDLITEFDCLLLKAKTEDVVKTLGGSLQEILNKSDIIDTLSKVSVFKNLSNTKMNLLTSKIGIENFEDGQKIITEGETGDKFYIVKKGKVDITVNGKYIRTLNEKEYFGERALFFNEHRSATITSKGQVSVFFLRQNDFMSTIEENMKQHLLNRLYLQDDTIELNDLLFVKTLGSGNYGSVSLVQSKKNKFTYAIKGISRKQINFEQLHNNLELERSILLQIDHPFIVKLVKTLKDERFIYFLMEYIQGKELFDTIRDIGLLSAFQTQFYGGSLLLAIEYLHNRKFIYRDLKPENVMVLNKNGYIKLIDFGTAKKITDRTSTIIGTPHYMAPEVVLGEGYSFQVDCWSIAICMYEFMCGGVPFGENADDPMEVYLSVVNTKLTFPSFCKDRDFKNLMTHMLNKNQVKRLIKIDRIKNHVWFQNFNWEQLIEMNMKAGYLPLGEEKEEEVLQATDKLFVDYAKVNYVEYEPKKDAFIDKGKMALFDQWYENY
jgi:cGMP-dependent protein kinase